MGQREGYLLVDHQASPGIPEHLALAWGLNPELVGEGKRLEAATLTCAHCKTAVMLRPERIRERHNCLKCSGKYICDACHLLSCMPDYSHEPFEKRLDDLKDLEAKGIPMLGSPPSLLLP